MNRRTQRISSKDEPGPERVGRRGMTFARTSRDDLLAQFRQARRRLGAAGRH
ncbi:MAG TPA: hypothetical protein VFX85_08405 [Solirubrobacterales bacterium]|nr:hypothetical protein [Solirubrobacterales bacterium]